MSTADALQSAYEQAGIAFIAETAPSLTGGADVRLTVSGVRFADRERRQVVGSGQCAVVLACSTVTQTKEVGMGWLSKLFDKTAKVHENQAVIITLDGTSLPNDVYEQFDSDTLDGQLQDALGSLGECDGVEHGESDTRIFLYGSDAEAMFRAVEPTLRAYPLAASSQGILRFGPPGTPKREVRLPQLGSAIGLKPDAPYAVRCLLRISRTVVACHVPPRRVTMPR
jgi:hypothetical protein